MNGELWSAAGKHVPHQSMEGPMPAVRTQMRRVREILMLKFEAGLAIREIVRRTGIPRRTVRTLFDRFDARGLRDPAPFGRHEPCGPNG